MKNTKDKPAKEYCKTCGQELPPKKENVACCVVDQFCDAPANQEDDGFVSARCICLICGEAVCKNCSVIIKNHPPRKGRKTRVCHNCLGGMDGNDDRVMRHLEKLARE